MRTKLQIIAIALLVLLTALAAATVQLYRHGRDEYRVFNARGLNDIGDIKIRDSLRNASDSLGNLQIYAANYVLTGRADSLKDYRESLEDWQYESGTLELLFADERRATLVRDFSQAGKQLASEMAAMVSLYGAGSHDAALDRLRMAAAMPYRDKIDKTKEAAWKSFGRVSGNRFYDSLKVSRRLIYCAGGLYVLGFSGLGLLLYLLRTTAGS